MSRGVMVKGLVAEVAGEEHAGCSGVAAHAARAWLAAPHSLAPLPPAPAVSPPAGCSLTQVSTLLSTSAASAGGAPSGLVLLASLAVIGLNAAALVSAAARRAAGEAQA